MSIHLACILETNQCELGHTNDGKHEDKQHKKETKRSHRWGSINKSFEDLLQLLLFLDKAENSSNSQSPQDSSQDFKTTSETSPGDT